MLPQELSKMSSALIQSNYGRSAQVYNPPFGSFPPVNQAGELVSSNQVLTLDVDPDNEFNWNEDALRGLLDDLVESQWS